MGVGTTFAASVGVGLAAGHWLDSRIGTDPYLLLAGGIVGLIAGSVHFFVTMSGGKR
jgi:F0F1-type ATP synthase assembly protein I